MQEGVSASAPHLLFTQRRSPLASRSRSILQCTSLHLELQNRCRPMGVFGLGSKAAPQELHLSMKRS